MENEKAKEDVVSIANLWENFFILLDDIVYHGEVEKLEKMHTEYKKNPYPEVYNLFPELELTMDEVEVIVESQCIFMDFLFQAIHARKNEIGVYNMLKAKRSVIQ